MNAFEQLLPSLQSHPLHQALGLHRFEAAGGRSRIEVTVDEARLNFAGVFHGSVIYTACDMACYIALMSELEPGENAVTHDIHLSLLRAAHLGQTVSFTGRILKRGRSLAFMESEAHSDGQLIARATVTKSLLRKTAG